MYYLKFMRLYHEIWEENRLCFNQERREGGGRKKLGDGWGQKRVGNNHNFLTIQQILIIHRSVLLIVLSFLKLLLKN